MAERPEIKPGEWIFVGDLACVVANVFVPGVSSGDCEVVFDPHKPTNRNARWNGSQWGFVETGDYDGYADKYPRLATMSGSWKLASGNLQYGHPAPDLPENPHLSNVIMASSLI